MLYTHFSLNRTFYGIETLVVLVVELNRNCLNRTFYGIETSECKRSLIFKTVLIVPFMELKPLSEEVTD